MTELKRALWNDLDRLREYLLLRDPHRTGRMSEKDCYTVLKACRLPFDKELINKIFKVIKKDENCYLFYEELLLFLDSKYCPMMDVPPINLKVFFIHVINILFNFNYFSMNCALKNQRTPGD